MIINLLYTIKDILHIFIHAKWNSATQFPMVDKSRKLRILGNGKSQNGVELRSEENIDYMVLNRHVLADNYVEIKPKHYVLADGHFFMREEGIKILKKIDEKTTWDMLLYVYYDKNTFNKLKALITNSHITLKTYNNFIFRGFKPMAYLLYDLKLAMPRTQNVLVAAIMLGISYKYRIIELYGVEHSWINYMSVDDENRVCLYNPHNYDKGEVKPKPISEIQHCETSIAKELSDYSKMFYSYMEIQKYLDTTKSDTKVINMTVGSFIDSFPRNNNTKCLNNE